MAQVDRVLRSSDAFDMIQSGYEVFEVLKDEKDFYGTVKMVLEKHADDDF